MWYHELKEVKNMSNEILTAISSVGFPIVACCFMGVYVVKLTNTLTELKTAITEMTATFKAKENKEE